jgi:hypothetical protein
MPVSGSFRGDPLKTTFVGEQLYLDAFNVLRPSSSELTSISASYKFYNCGFLERMRAHVTPSWQSIRTDLVSAIADTNLALYSDGEIRGFVQSKVRKDTTVFAETHAFLPGKLHATDAVAARVGVDYENLDGPIRGARITLNSNGTNELGIAIPVSKEVSVILGSMNTEVNKPENVTIGVKVQPCRHFNVSVSDTYKVSDGTHRKSFSFFAQPQKSVEYALLGALGDRDPAEIMLGLTYEPSHEKPTFAKGMKLRTFLDVMTMASRHEMTFPFQESYLSLGLSMSGNWRAPKPILSFRLHVES